MPVSAVQVLIRAINAQDTAALDGCISEDHALIDAHGTEVKGRHTVLNAWKDYFGLFPDYHIDIEEIYGSGSTVAVFGRASATRAGARVENRDSHWDLPAAWRAVVENGTVVKWQVYADTKIPYDILRRTESPRH